MHVKIALHEDCMELIFLGGKRDGSHHTRIAAKIGRFDSDTFGRDHANSLLNLCANPVEQNIPHVCDTTTQDDKFGV